LSRFATTSKSPDFRIVKPGDYGRTVGFMSDRAAELRAVQLASARERMKLAAGSRTVPKVNNSVEMGKFTRKGKKVVRTAFTPARLVGNKIAKSVIPGGDKMVEAKKRMMSNSNSKGSKLVERAKESAKNISGGVSFGKDQWTGLVPIVLAVGFVIFMIFSFGKGKLFGKSKRR
jgi:hypothetical protein